MKYLANAKLNLMLRIVGKRADGYHLLEMINTPIDLYDEVEINLERSKEFKLNQQFFPPLDCPLEKTTIYKAFQLFKGLLKGPHEITVNVKKGIPSGAGMGGGSSDAAFFIKALCEHFHIDITEPLLRDIANRVGADVPFFIYNRPALVGGIGELVKPFKTFPTLYFVVVVPDFAISTRWAYENVKMALTNKDNDIMIKNSEMDVERLLEVMENDLEGAVLAHYPLIGAIKEAILHSGALKAMMTGSGSAVFGLYDSLEAQKRGLEGIRERFPAFRLFTCKTIGV